MNRVFLSAGEASGDAYAAALVSEIGARRSGVQFEGIGGAKLAATGAVVAEDTSRWGAIGVMQALARAPRVIRGYYKTKFTLAAGEPGVFIPIDFGYVNIRLARHAKGHGWKVLYFIPPGSWRRDKQGKDLPAVTDTIVTPFSWSAEILNRMGADAHWFGHPLKQLVWSRTKKQPVGEDRDTVAVLPGSRSHELEANLPVLARVLEAWPGRAEFALAQGAALADVRSRWESLTGRKDLFRVGDTLGVLLRARASLVCSGTASLESALCGCPAVVFYELTATMRLEARALWSKRPKFIALPNILLDREAVPEHWSLTGVDSATIRRQLNDLWNSDSARSAQLEAFAEIDRVTGGNDGITRTAGLAIGLLG